MGWRAAVSRLWRGSRLLRDSRGSVAIEFSFLVFPFALITFTILESCVSFAAQELLANATDEIAREMRTGKIKPADIDEPKLKQMVCDRIALLAPSSCLSDVVLDLKKHDTFAEVAKERVAVANDKIVIMTSATTSRPTKVEPLGVAGTKNTFRVFYKWPMTTHFVAEQMGTPLPDERMLHFASVTWQNEPFDD